MFFFFSPGKSDMMSPTNFNPPIFWGAGVGCQGLNTWRTFAAWNDASPCWSWRENCIEQLCGYVFGSRNHVKTMVSWKKSYNYESIDLPFGVKHAAVPASCSSKSNWKLLGVASGNFPERVVSYFLNLQLAIDQHDKSIQIIYDSFHSFLKKVDSCGSLYVVFTNRLHRPSSYGDGKKTTHLATSHFLSSRAGSRRFSSSYLETRRPHNGHIKKWPQWHGNMET